MGVLLYAPPPTGPSAAVLPAPYLYATFVRWGEGLDSWCGVECV